MDSKYGLRIRSLCKSFPSNGTEVVHALRDFEIDAAPGEFVVLVGPNGSGKSTLLNLLAGDFPPDSGSIELLDGNATVDWSKMPRWERASYLARVHQDPRQGTAAGMTIWENLRLFTARHGVPSPLVFRSSNRDRDWFAERLAALGLPGKIDARIAELSHGQRQLLALQFAMLRHPAFLLLDEHTASLDRDNARQCLEATVRLSREHWTGILMVTHNLVDALNFGDRLLIMRDGRILENLTADRKRSLDLQTLVDMCGYDV